MEYRKRRFFFFWLIVGVVLGTAIPLLIFDGTRITLNNTTTTVVPTTTVTTTTTMVPTTTPNPNGCIIQPPPSITPVCDPLYNLSYQESPNLSYDGILLRFFYDTNFRRPIYIYQPLNNIEIIVVTPTWNYTINVGYNPDRSFLLVDCSGNIYVLYSTIYSTLMGETNIFKIDPFGVLQWTNSIIGSIQLWEPSIYLNNIYFLSLNRTTLGDSSLVKIDINNGFASFLPNVVCINSNKCRLNVFADKIYNLQQIGPMPPFGPISMYDLNGTFINQGINIFNPYGSYVSPDGFLYYLGYESEFSTNGNIFKIDRNLTLIWNITLTGSAANFIPWTMDFMATKLFVYQDILYYIASTSYTNGITYLSSYSDIDGSFISTTNHAFSNNLGDVTMNFDPLSKSAYFLGLQQPDGINPIPAAINTFCIP